MSRGELRTLLEQTAQRVGDTQAPWESFIDRATTRIGRDLRARENTAISTVSDPYLLPSGFEEMILVEAEMGGAWQPVRPAGGNEASIAQRNNGAYPLIYWVADGAIYPRPDTGADLRVTAYTSLPLGSLPSDTNAVLDAFEQLYLAAAMVFFAQWSQDESLLGYWTGEYQSEVLTINESRRQQRQPVSISDYRYQGGTFAT